MSMFFGVVEDVLDPLKTGRVRVRVMGLHNDDKQEIPTGALPWAQVMTPVTSASATGVGETPSLVPGSWVVLTFTDSALQDPLVLGSLNGIPTEKLATNKGFADPNGNYPIQDRLNKPDLHARTRGERYEADVAFTGSSSLTTPDLGWDSFAPEYPYNKVKATESGHYKEYDDTPGKTRIKEMHASGTFYEIQPDGTIVTYIKRDRYNIILRNDEIIVGGNVKMIVGGNVDLTCNKNVTATVSGKTELVANGSVTLVSAGSDMRLQAQQNMTIVGDKIHLNPPGSKGWGAADPALIDIPVLYEEYILNPVVGEGEPANTEQVEQNVQQYEQVAPATCADTPLNNPYDVAYQASVSADWKETGSNPNIAALWDEIGYDGSRYADQTAWCAVFVGATLKRAGMEYIQTASSRAYANYGTEVELEDVKKGDIVVFYRGGISSGTGHVGFATGKKTSTTIEVLGGNQSNDLTVRSYKLNNPASGWGLVSIRRGVSCDDGSTPPPDANF